MKIKLDWRYDWRLGFTIIASAAAAVAVLDIMVLNSTWYLLELVAMVGCMRLVGDPEINTNHPKWKL